MTDVVVHIKNHSCLQKLKGFYPISFSSFTLFGCIVYLDLLVYYSVNYK